MAADTVAVVVSAVAGKTNRIVDLIVVKTFKTKGDRVMNRVFKYYKKGEEPFRFYLQSIRNEDLENLHQKIIDLQLGRGRIMFGMFAGVSQKTYDWKSLEKICAFVENEINKRNTFRLKTILEVFEKATPFIKKGLQEGLTTSEYSSLTSSLSCACSMINEYNLSMDTVWNKSETTSEGMQDNIEPVLHVAGVGTAASGKSAEYEILSDSIDMLEKAGYKVNIHNITAPSGRFNSFDSMYDIFGDERKSFVEKLSKIFSLTIIEEDDTHIRIAYTEKNYAGTSIDEQQKIYFEFTDLMNSVKGKIEMIKVQEN